MFHNFSLGEYGFVSRDNASTNQPEEDVSTRDWLNNDSSMTSTGGIMSADVNSKPGYAPATEGAATAVPQDAPTSNILSRIWEASSMETNTDAATISPWVTAQEQINRNASSSYFQATTLDNASNTETANSWVDAANLSMRVNASAGWMWQYFDTMDSATSAPVVASTLDAFENRTEVGAFTTIVLSPLLTLITSPGPQNGAAFAHAGFVSWEIVIKVIVLAVISIAGFLGNVKAIWSVIKESHLHRPPFYFLLSLGVTDLSRAVFCLPVVITTVLHGAKWRHGESACKLFAFATSFFIFSSALSLLAIAIDRHVSVVYSKTYRRRSLGIANLIAAIVIWVVAFSVSFPPVVGVGDYVFIPEEAQCAYQHKHYSGNDSVSSVLVFLAILFLTYFLYFRIFRFLRAHRRMRPLQHTPARSSNWAFVGPGANGQAFINWLNGFGGQVPIRQGGQRAVQRLNFGRVVNLSSAKNEHLTRLFLMLTLVFGLSWTPYIILSLWRIFLDVTLLPTPYVTIAAWLGYAQVAFCPMVYFMCRGPSKKGHRTVYSPAEKREFLLENKIGK